MNRKEHYERTDAIAKKHGWSTHDASGGDVYLRHKSHAGQEIHVDPESWHHYTYDSKEGGPQSSLKRGEGHDSLDRHLGRLAEETSGPSEHALSEARRIISESRSNRDISDLTMKVKHHHPLNQHFLDHGFARDSGAGNPTKTHVPFYYRTVKSDHDIHKALTSGGYKHLGKNEHGSDEYEHPKYGKGYVALGHKAWLNVPKEHTVHTPDGVSPKNYDKSGR